METNLFHFLRPEWFWALIPAGLLLWLVLRASKNATGSDWGRYVDAHLLRHLAISGATARASRVLPSAAAAMLLVLVTALAGPTWEKAQMPSFTSGEPVVAVLSLAQSMNSDDLSPSRLRTAVHKLRDILARTEGNERALVIYSDVPFVAAPLTSDQKVISQMIPELSTNLMPVLGDRPDLAISEAESVLKGAHASRGKIVLLADNAGNRAATEKAAAAARKAGYTVSVLGIGTEKGATLQTAGGQAITDSSGGKVTTSLDAEGLSAVASAGGGTYSSVTANSADLDRILPKTDKVETAGKVDDFHADGWVDMGYWLLILPVLLLAFAFRRGLVFSIGLIACLNFVPGIATRPAHAGTWQDLWATSDQQGKKAFASGDYKTASGKFETPSWRGSAAYRAGDYKTAAQDFSASAYNRGNALAKSGQLKEALGAYDQALASNPHDADAKYNRDLVQKLLDEQKRQQEQEKNKQQQSQGQSGQQNQQSGSQGQQKQQNAGGQQNQQQQAGGKGQKQDQQQSQGQSGQQGQQDQQSGSKQKQTGGQSGDQQQSATQPGQENGSQNGVGQQSASQGEQPRDQASAQSSKPADEAKGGQSPKAGAEKSAAEKAQDQNAAAGKEQKQEASATNPQGQQSANEQAGQQQQDKSGPEGLAQADKAAQKAAEARQQASASGNGSEQARKDSENALSKMLASMLDGNGKDNGGKPVKASVPGAPVVDQAVEQQLREVPDDPSGLLRARIRQHYAELRSGAN
ncbi:VWA domain-containing protein [Rhizobium sp. C1]|uniref:VWA domain-containing protein n=1 Tax=Rhizobium sp. C1 TaxID=1349799 RepID=UPI001E65A63F|nr:VWA domain-containing protein [Rhizobium sp. C1]MCD2179428.1 VWA domain-containing protein [Rhizobium sp. C1]